MEKLLNSRVIMVILILAGISVNVAFATDVTIKEGTVDANMVTVTDKVGINTTSPSCALDVDDGDIRVDGDADVSGTVDANMITVTDKIGIGTTSPSCALDVNLGALNIIGPNGIQNGYTAADVLYVRGGNGADNGGLDAYSGSGSDIWIYAGHGGNGQSCATGGYGGDISIIAGKGGDGSFPGNARNGGDIILSPGYPGSGPGDPIYGDIKLALQGGNVGISSNVPSYPLTVRGDVSGTSIWAEADISATGFNTRTSVYDKSKGSAMDYIQDADYYLDAEGQVDHSNFYGHKTHKITDRSRPEEEEVEYEGETYTATVYPHEKQEHAVSLEAEINVLRQALYELKTELCARDSSYSFCE